MDRQEKFSEAYVTVESSTFEVLALLNEPRDYGTGEALHMREIHFIDIISRYPHLEMGAIAEKLDVSHGAISQLADRLVKKGYINRMKNPDDNRRFFCELTDNGEKAAAGFLRCRAGYALALGKNCADIADSEVDSFVRVAKRFVEELTKAARI